MHKLVSLKSQFNCGPDISNFFYILKDFQMTFLLVDFLQTSDLFCYHTKNSSLERALKYKEDETLGGGVVVFIICLSQGDCLSSYQRE